MRTLFTDIKELVLTEADNALSNVLKGTEMDAIETLSNAWLLLEDGLIHAFGSMDTMPELQAHETYNLNGSYVLPTYIDSHTHLVFSHYREQEFEDRIHGLTYEEIAQRGGGILNSARRMQEITEEELFKLSKEKLEAVIASGTGGLEIKSGYGLNTQAELKMLRVIQRLKEQAPIPIKASFLAAHTYPLEFRENHEGYLNLIIQEMLPLIAQEKLADYMDVFCERGFFSAEETDRLLEAGYKYGLKPKIHANQLYNSGGVQVGVKHNAISVDHLETMDEEEVACLKNSNTIATLLPGAAFFLAMHYQPARKLIDAGLPVALASDYNPGSCPSYNMNFIQTLACSQMKMTPKEALSASTLNGAAALELQTCLGSIQKGKIANLMITKPMPSLAFLAYAFGEQVIDQVWIKGKRIR
ncbi:MAG: imidazolonepropionase [Chitinophagaceae bacterium]|nr:imidazolonepropionase [Chitinophagaceae bacterium]